MTDYSIQAYGSMIADPVRMSAFTRALERTIRPGSIVLDIGTGTGIFAMLACRYGAAHVYAIEASPAIEVARQMAKVNGFGDRITFFNAMSTKVELPRRADVMISDLRGIMPWFEHHIPSIVDARERLVKPRGVLIPAKDTAYAAVAETAESLNSLVAGYRHNRYGLDMSLAERLASNQMLSGRPSFHQLLVKPQSFAVLDYETVVDPDFSADLRWEVSRDGAAYGLALWFDRDLAKGITESHAPDAYPGEQPPMIHGNAILPFPRPVSVREGDSIALTLSAELGKSDYTWSWATKIERRAPGSKPGRKAKAETISFVQSTLLGEWPTPPESLAKADAEYLPALNEDGRILVEVMRAMDGDTENEIIAERLRAAFPKVFTTEEKALERVAEVARMYSD